MRKLLQLIGSASLAFITGVRADESSKKAKAGTVSATELAAQKIASNTATGNTGSVGAQYQGQLSAEPTYDQIRDADTKIEKLQEEVKSFEFRGYLRSGYVLNSAGDQQAAFEAPGADAKYRLETEAETYAELIFVNTGEPGSRHGQGLVPHRSHGGGQYHKLRQCSQLSEWCWKRSVPFPGSLRPGREPAGCATGREVLAGERYYRRQHIDIDDFYPLDMSGHGAGVEDLNLLFRR